MADGSRQHGFNFPRKSLVSALRPGEIIVDFFAGGGGASEALRQALGRDPDVAVNHDHQAIGMHAANHPFTKHMEADVWTVDIVREVAGRLVGWFHASPDCTHFSQAKGGQPRDRATRSLSWVVLKVAGTLARQGLAPRIISLENVEQILKWGPLVAKRDKATGRVMKLDGSVAAKGERVPLREQFLIPDKRHSGRTWSQFVAALRALGYAVEWRKLTAADFGAGTSRSRLFMVARRDGQPIVWPEPTHGPGRQHPFVTAADCIDWSVSCPSIFERKRPLADATCRRIAKGVRRYVLDAAEPFFITEHANGSNQRTWSGNEPLRTQCAGVKGGHFALVSAFLEQANGGGENGNPARARAATEPVSSITGTGSQQRIVTAHMAKLRGTSAAADVCDPLATISAGGEHHAVVTGHLTAFGQNAKGTDAREPMQTALGGATRFGVVECTLSQEHEASALRVAAFLMRYHSCGGQHAELGEPVTTVTTKDRLALVTVTIKGTAYVIVDIGLRMLRREELYRAQGFPADYIIDRTAEGSTLSISASVRMVGNSVSPPPLAAIARANLDPAEVTERIAA